MSYLVLHHYATTNVPYAPLPQYDVGGMMLRSLAVPGQYIIPAVFLMGAAGSWFGRRKREGLLARETQ